MANFKIDPWKDKLFLYTKIHTMSSFKFHIQEDLISPDGCSMEINQCGTYIEIKLKTIHSRLIKTMYGK